MNEAENAFLQPQPTQGILIYGTPREFLMRLQGWENPHRGEQS